MTRFLNSFVLAVSIVVFVVFTAALIDPVVDIVKEYNGEKGKTREANTDCIQIERMYRTQCNIKCTCQQFRYNTDSNTDNQQNNTLVEGKLQYGK